MGLVNAVNKIITGKSLKSIGVGGWTSIGLNTYFGVDMYKTAREEGHGAIGSAMRAGGELAIMEMMGIGPYLGLMAVKELPVLGVQGFMKVNETARSMSRVNRNKPFSNANFMDTQQAFTMRQAGLQLAKASKYNLQQTVMGNEASYLHY